MPILVLQDFTRLMITITQQEADNLQAAPAGFQVVVDAVSTDQQGKAFRKVQVILTKE